MWRVFAPLKYLRIDHPEKSKFDIYLPAFFGLLFCIPLLSSEFQQDEAGRLEFLGKIGDFLGVLTGFFIAALAAVATFGYSEMDAPMPGEPSVRLRHVKNAETYFERLSRRRFLSFLFGYMSFITLILYIATYCYVVADKYFIGADSRITAFVIFWVIFMFALANILSNTFLGLFYLTDRIHRPNQTLKTKDGDGDQGSV